jgi:hypothetical protein
MSVTHRATTDTVDAGDEWQPAGGGVVGSVGLGADPWMQPGGHDLDQLLVLIGRN